MIPTQDHEQIRRWAAAHDAVPAERATRKFDGEPAVLHFLCGAAKAGTPDLRPITWEDFFGRFDLFELSVAFDDDTGGFQIVRVEKSIPTGLAN